jgi:hypothetical protein
VARTDGLLIEELGDEAIIYDLKRDRVHHLNHTALVVWRRCDGRTPPETIARSIHETTGLPQEPAIITFALEQLHDAELILGSRRVEGAAVDDMPTRSQAADADDLNGADAALARIQALELSRRRLLLLGLSAAAVPLVSSIVAPTPAMAQSLYCPAGWLPEDVRKSDEFRNHNLVNQEGSDCRWNELVLDSTRNEWGYCCSSINLKKDCSWKDDADSTGPILLCSPI